MTDHTDRLLTASALAGALAVSLSTIRRMTRDGEIPVVRLRTLVRYDLDAVLAARVAEEDVHEVLNASGQRR